MDTSAIEAMRWSWQVHYIGETEGETDRGRERQIETDRGRERKRSSYMRQKGCNGADRLIILDRDFFPYMLAQHVLSYHRIYHGANESLFAGTLGVHCTAILPISCVDKFLNSSRKHFSANLIGANMVLTLDGNPRTCCSCIKENKSFRRKKNRFATAEEDKKKQRLLLTCATISELPHNISIMMQLEIGIETLDICHV